MVILAWVAIALLAFGILGLLALAVPLELTFRAARGDGTRPSVSLRWLFGRVHREFRASEDDDSKKETRDKKKSSKGVRFSWRLTSFDFVTRLARLGWRLLRKIELKELVVRGRFGTGDPGQTGILYGVSHVFIGPANRLPNVEIEMSPSFVEAGFDGEAYGTLRVVPLKLLLPVAEFFIMPSNIRAMVQLRRSMS